MTGAADFREVFQSFPATPAELSSIRQAAYPVELRESVVALTRGRDLAWDAACGDGGVAIDLVNYFGRVLATDSDPSSIRNALGKRGIEYRVAEAEDSPLGDLSTDLIVVAQALHRFRFEEFYREVRRVSKRGGILAVWANSFFRSDETDLDRAMAQIGLTTLASCWTAEERLVWDGYAGLRFPFREQAMPSLRLTVEWTLREYLLHVAEWPASRRYLTATGNHPAEETFAELISAWGAPESRRTLTSPLVLRAGRIE